MNYGYTVRNTPKLQPRRGFSPGTPNAQTKTIAIHPYYADGGTAPIVSGEVISVAIVSDTPYWVKGRGEALVSAGGTHGGVAAPGTAVAHTAPVYVAFQDAAGYDVKASGKLLGLDTNGNYTLATAFYAGLASTYVEGAPLTVGLTTNEGKIVVFDPTDAAEDHLPVIGYVSKGVHNIWNEIDEAAYANSNVVEFNTTFGVPRVTEA